MAADLQEQAVQVEWKAAKITAAALKGLIEQILANREKITHGEQSLSRVIRITIIITAPCNSPLTVEKEPCNFTSLPLIR